MATEPDPTPEAAAPGPQRPIPDLTARETEVLRLVATGMSYKEIASELFLSHRTVQNHVQNTLGKLHLHNRVELVRFALARGLEDDDPAGSATP